MIITICKVQSHLLTIAVINFQIQMMIYFSAQHLKLKFEKS